MSAHNIIKHTIIIAFLLFATMTKAYASPEEAQVFIKKISEQAIEIVKSISIDDAEKEKRLIEIFNDSVDTKWIAKFVMGRHWREASADQKDRYVDLHNKFLINSYVPKFRQYTNQKIKFKRFFDEGDNEYLIETLIVQPDGPAINVDYKVRKNADGVFRIFDVIAEGVSLITTQRSEFSSILSRKGVEELIKKLQSRV